MSKQSIRSMFPATTKALATPRSGKVKMTALQLPQNRELRSKTQAHSSRNFHRKYHAPFIHFQKFLYFARGNAYANMLAPPVSMASISAWVQGRRPKREGSSARSKNSPLWGLTGPREAPEWPPMVLLKEERPRGPCC